MTKRRKESQSELVADGNEDDESIALEPSGKPKEKERQESEEEKVFAKRW